MLWFQARRQEDKKVGVGSATDSRLNPSMIFAHGVLYPCQPQPGSTVY